MKRTAAALITAAALLWHTPLYMPAHADEQAARAVLNGATLTLSGGIQMNFYITVDKGAQGDITLQTPSGEKSFSLLRLTAVGENENGSQYRVSVPVEPAQAQDKISVSVAGARLFKQGGKTQYENGTALFSVSDYIECVKKDEGASQSLKRLTESLGSYAAAVKKGSGDEEITRAKADYTAALEDYIRSKDTVSPAAIELKDTDGQGRNFTFVYGGEQFNAEFSYRYDGKENWRIYDSYKITNEADMIAICQALINIHTIRGRDLQSLRTPQDMAQEWKIHNRAYNMLSGSGAKTRCKDVDFDPDDQGKSFGDFILQYFNE